MTTKKITAFRQGDVVLTPVTIEVKSLKKLGHTILALGEVTGHKHQVATLEPEAATLYDITDRAELETVCKQFLPDYRWQDLPDGSVRLLEVTKATTVTHEEHKAVTLKPGKYVVNIQQAYQPGPVKLVAD
jgi:hypothetical protein